MYLLRLYVAGMMPHSTRAIANARRICEQHLEGNYRLEIVDLYQQPDLASRDQIVVVPTLLKVRPPPRRYLAGDLWDEVRILEELQLWKVTSSEGPITRREGLPRDAGEPHGRPKKARARTSRLMQVVDERIHKTAKMMQQSDAILERTLDAFVHRTQLGENRIITHHGVQDPYRAIVEAMRDGLAIVGPDGTVAYCNRRFAAMVHARLEEVTGSPLLRWLEPRHKDLLVFVRECPERADPCEVAFRTHAGTRVVAHVSANAVELESGGPLLCLVARVSRT